MQSSQEISQLRDALQTQLISEPDSLIQIFVDHFRKHYGQNIAAIVFYGSCLFQEIRSPTSLYDFYILTDHVYPFYRSFKHTMLNGILPPNVYYRRIQHKERQLELQCKFCVLSMAQFIKETSEHASDIHHLGRFTKRFALVYSRDENVSKRVVESVICGLLALVPHALVHLPVRFSLEEFILAALSLSYIGEHRVAEPDKVKKLYLASQKFYLDIFPLVLSHYFSEHNTPRCMGENTYSQTSPSLHSKIQTQLFLEKSRVRGILRWPKYILTVENWLEYLLNKLERHQGIHLELTEREKKYPLIFGWHRFFELKRKGIVS